MSTLTIDVDSDVRNTLTIDAAAFRTAALAAHPHADDNPEAYRYHRVRMSVATEVSFAAANPYTAIVTRIDPGNVDPDFTPPDRAWRIDLHPVDLAAICKMFKPGKDEQLTLRVDEHLDGRVTFTDKSGLFDGRAYTVPTVGGGDDMPDVARLLRGHLTTERPRYTGAVAVGGESLRRFAATAAQYMGQVHFEPTSERVFLVNVGEDAIGVLVARSNDDEAADRVVTVRRDWLDRLLPTPTP